MVMSLYLCVSFMCCVTDSYKLSSSEQSTFIISHFLWNSSLGMA